MSEALGALAASASDSSSPARLSHGAATFANLAKEGSVTDLMPATDKPAQEAANEPVAAVAPQPVPAPVTTQGSSPAVPVQEPVMKAVTASQAPAHAMEGQNGPQAQAPATVPAEESVAQETVPALSSGDSASAKLAAISNFEHMSDVLQRSDEMLQSLFALGRELASKDKPKENAVQSQLDKIQNLSMQIDLHNQGKGSHNPDFQEQSLTFEELMGGDLDLDPSPLEENLRAAGADLPDPAAGFGLGETLQQGAPALPQESPMSQPQQALQAGSPQTTLNLIDAEVDPFAHADAVLPTVTQQGAPALPQEAPLAQPQPQQALRAGAPQIQLAPLDAEVDPFAQADAVLPTVTQESALAAENSLQVNPAPRGLMESQGQAGSGAIQSLGELSAAPLGNDSASAVAPKADLAPGEDLSSLPVQELTGDPFSGEPQMISALAAPEPEHFDYRKKMQDEAVKLQQEMAKPGRALSAAELQNAIMAQDDEEGPDESASNAVKDEALPAAGPDVPAAPVVEEAAPAPLAPEEPFEPQAHLAPQEQLQPPAPLSPQAQAPAPAPLAPLAPMPVQTALSPQFAPGAPLEQDGGHFDEGAQVPAGAFAPSAQGAPADDFDESFYESIAEEPRELADLLDVQPAPPALKVSDGNPHRVPETIRPVVEEAFGGKILGMALVQDDDFYPQLAKQDPFYALIDRMDLNNMDKAVLVHGSLEFADPGQSAAVLTLLNEHQVLSGDKAFQERIAKALEQALGHKVKLEFHLTAVEQENSPGHLVQQLHRKAVSAAHGALLSDPNLQQLASAFKEDLGSAGVALLKPANN